ncbi:cyclic nucleotide-binding domain-containing protein [Emticicia sp. CRIBPO]|uniref:Crp/Fnr family transcriptional regulator n=1 Tax=Emticicia sp. CRIBPO TaxID=2683258 RepID=UPI00141365A1|nr:Crp/Fnr family transcriptional regulator [Emticicia sp. CRIBPO]NBA85335.1 cyclic nucleotide-binding domain-containing protein [Emticicia sp. CRIBPO]
MNPKSAYLETLSLFTSFNEVELDLIKRCLEVKKYSKGEFLLKEGEYSEHIIFITTGLLREYYHLSQNDSDTSFHLADGNNTYEDNACTSWIMGEGNFVYNVRSFLEDRPSKCYILAEEDSTVVIISKADLTYLLETIPKMERIVRMLQERGLMEYERRLELLREKDTLLRYQKFIEAYPNLQNRISLKKIATYLNISPRHLSRIRSQPVRK